MWCSHRMYGVMSMSVLKHAHCVHTCVCMCVCACVPLCLCVPLSLCLHVCCVYACCMYVVVVACCYCTFRFLIHGLVNMQGNR